MNKNKECTVTIPNTPQKEVGVTWHKKVSPQGNTYNYEKVRVNWFRFRWLHIV